MINQSDNADPLQRMAVVGHCSPAEMMLTLTKYARVQCDQGGISEAVWILSMARSYGKVEAFAEQHYCASYKACCMVSECQKVLGTSKGHESADNRNGQMLKSPCIHADLQDFMKVDQRHAVHAVGCNGWLASVAHLQARVRALAISASLSRSKT